MEFILLPFVYVVYVVLVLLAKENLNKAKRVS